LDYPLFKSIDKSVKSLFKNGQPLHHLISAKSREYDPASSKFFVTNNEELDQMSPQEVQDIFRHRHILVPGKSSGKKFDRAALRFLGSMTQKRTIQGECCAIYDRYFLSLMRYKVNERRTVDDPENMLMQGTFEDLLRVDDDGKRPILNVLDIPLGGATIDIPKKFE
jgi:hypothetical protein